MCEKQKLEILLGLIFPSGLHRSLKLQEHQTTVMLTFEKSQ